MNKLFTLLLLSAFLLSAQELPEKIKYDTKTISLNGRTALITKGKKSAVYNFDKKAYDIYPTKNAIIYFEDLEVYAEISKEKISLYMIHKEGVASFHKRRNTDSTFLGLYFPVVGSSVFEHIVYYNELWINYLSGDIKTDFSEGIEWEELEFEKKLSIKELGEDHLLIQNTHISIIGPEPFNEDNYIVVDSGYSKSGVYNVKTKSWEVQPVYENCNELNGFLFCSKLDSMRADEEEYSPIVNTYYSYDIYRLMDGMWMIQNKDVTDIENLPLSEILKVDSIFSRDDLGNVVAWNNGKLGFSKVQLFKIDRFYIPHFGYQQILPYDYDLILNENADQMILTYKDKDRLSMGLYLYEEISDSIIIVDTIALANEELVLSSTNEYSCALWIDSISTNDIDYYESDHYKDRRLGLIKLNDSLVKVINYFFETPVEVYDEYDEVTYFGESFEMEKSGVFNINSGQWILEPLYHNCFQLNAGWIIANSVKIEKESYWQQYERIGNYTILDDELTIIRKDLDLGDLLSEENFIQQIVVEYDIDTAFKAPSGLYSGYTDAERPDYYYRFKNMVGLVYPVSNDCKKLYTITSPFEFIHTNTNLNYSFYIENDSVFFEKDSVKLGVSVENGALIVNYNLNSDDACRSYQVLMIQNSDTIKYNSIKPVEGKKCYNENVFAAVNISNDALVISEQYTTEDYFHDSYDEGFMSIKEIENSSIWHRSNSVWLKKTPYYASVVKVGKRYIVSTANYGGEPIIDESDAFIFDELTGDFKLQNQRDKRYLLLDENCSPVSFLDWYDFPLIEDLGYGIQIKMNESFFFVDYNGNSVTDAEWDNFEFEDGKLKAIREDVFKINEWGEEEIDENGDFVFEQKAKIQFFNLPSTKN